MAVICRIVNLCGHFSNSAQVSLVRNVCQPFNILCCVFSFAQENHRLASPVLTATGLVNGRGQFSTPHRIETPQPITKIFVTGDYVGNPYSGAKFGAHKPTGADRHIDKT